MIHSLILECWWVAWFALQPTHSLEYTVWHGEDIVGHMQVERYERGEQTTIKVKMEAEVKLLFSLAVTSTYETTFEEGEMIAAQVRTYRNGDLHSYTNCWRKDGQLHIDRDGQRSWLASSVQYTIANFYFEPPSYQQQVFSERFGSFQSFEQVDQEHYRLDLSDGSRSTYHYQNGLCQSVEIETWITDLRLELK